MNALQAPLARLLVAAAVAVPALSVSETASAATPLVDARLSVVLVQFNGQFETTGPASAARPGDVLEYVARYSNRGTAPAESLMPTMAIPVGTEYLPGNDLSKPAYASLDGTTYQPVPLHSSVRSADGTLHDIEVPLRDYRFLRWNVGTLPAGSEVVVRARARISPVSLARY